MGICQAQILLTMEVSMNLHVLRFSRGRALRPARFYEVIIMKRVLTTISLMALVILPEYLWAMTVPGFLC
jgi:hypothetical protein